MKKKLFLSIFLLVMMVMILPERSAWANDDLVYSEADYKVLPDRYNTGVKEADELVKAAVGNIANVNYRMSGKDLAINFYANRGLSGVIETSNVDFSDLALRVYSAEIVTDEIVLVYNNCKFGYFRSFEDGGVKVSFIFNNCSFEHCSGSNITLNNCYFGGGVVDCLNPYNNVYVNDCYFADKAIQNIVDNSGVHTDCVQIYGSSKFGCGNIHFDNCRFEMPYLVGSANAVNAPMMFAIEFCDADDITFDNCYVNGGGYTVYTTVSNGYTISNSYLKNIYVGCASRWGALYPRVAEDVMFDNFTFADRLYVGSVWKSEENVHISVTNDTEVERLLMVRTDMGEQYFSIPACYKYSELDERIGFEDFPFDIDIEIGDVEWLACYDVTNGYENQIRLVDFAGNQGWIKSEFEEMFEDEVIQVEVGLEYSEEISPLAFGECGKDARWEVIGDTLYIVGKGNMWDYHSKNVAPWFEYADCICHVVVSEGIVQIGTQAFKNLYNLVDVELPNSLKVLRSNAFQECKKMVSLVLPESLERIDDLVFHGTGLKSVLFNNKEYR